MTYRYIKSRNNYSDFASGKIFYGAPDQPSFPVRLVHEIFQRCLIIWRTMGNKGSCTLYDPLCGGAYHLATLAYFNWENINQIIGSDIDESALSYAQRNLNLLSLGGLDKRLQEISILRDLYQKPSHAAALRSGQALRATLLSHLKIHPIKTSLFRADATHSDILLQNIGEKKVDIVITDIPYGRRSDWKFENNINENYEEPVQMILESIRSVLSEEGVVALAASKHTRIEHEGYKQVGKLKLGKRQIIFLKLQ